MTGPAGMTAPGVSAVNLDPEASFGPVHSRDVVGDLAACGEHGVGTGLVVTSSVVLQVPSGVSYSLDNDAESLTGCLEVPAGTQADVRGVGVTAHRLHIMVNTFVVAPPSSPVSLWTGELAVQTAGYLRTVNAAHGAPADWVNLDLGPWGTCLRGQVGAGATPREQFYVVAGCGDTWLLRLTVFGERIGEAEKAVVDSVLADAVVTTPDPGELNLPETQPWAPTDMTLVM